ncbi:MAG: membrane lipoprotein lipid attachment site-containing protein [Firmicutes bacterium]|nr:membrane lipoprotein lipid attachment site-containing protein [Bacillota bacterium]
MKKILLFLVALFVTLGLAACNSSTVGEFPTFNENDAVELSATEMVALFENIDYTSVDSESVRISVVGNLHTISEEVDGTYSSYNEVKLDIDAVLFALVSEQVEESRLFAEATIDFYTKDEEIGSYWGDYSDEMSLVGDAGIYFYDQYLYMNVDMEAVEDEVEESAVFKQKLNQQVTQEMWDEAFGMADPDAIDEFVPIPQEYLDMLENGEFDEIMDAIPNLKVYKDGNTYSIVFSINKQGIMDSMLDVAVAVMAEADPDMSLADITEMVNDAKTELNRVVDELTFDFVISITENRVTKLAVSVVFLSEEENIDIDMTLIIDIDADLPKFPSDLDEYEAVDEPGEGVFE